MFQQGWIPLIRQGLQRFFAKRGANTDITSLSGLTGPLTRASYIDLSEQGAIASPAADTARLGAIDVDSITALVYKSPTGFESRVLRDQLYIVRNVSGVTLTKGTVVKVSGVSGSGASAVITVTRAQSNAAGTMPALGILAQDIANNTSGRCLVVGRIDGIDTSAYAAMDLLYVSPTVAGGLTNVRPSTPNRAQPIAQVINSNASNGAITVLIDPVLNEGLSTVQNSFTIGDSTAGVKSLKFAGTTVRSLYDGSTAPASPLVGDTWTARNSSTQAIVGEWEWNGTYWLSPPFYSFATTQTAVASLNVNALPFTGFDLFIESVSVSGIATAANNASNYHDLDLWQFTSAGGNGRLIDNLFNTSAIAANHSYSATIAINTFYATPEVPGGQSGALNLQYFIQLAVGAGAPGNIPRASLTLRFRYARR